MSRRVIRVDAFYLHETAKELLSLADILGEEVIPELNKIMRELLTKWRGESAIVFLCRMKQYRPYFIALEKLMRDMAAVLNSAADTAIEVDTQNRINLGSL